MREKKEKIFNSIGLNEEYTTKYKTVMNKFDDCFVIHKKIPSLKGSNLKCES